MGFMVGLGIALTKNYKAGGSVAMAALIAAGGFGLVLASADDSMAIVDAGTPANDYQGTPGAKLTTTRASAAKYWDANGVLQSAGNGVLRRDFDPRLSATAERCGYLIEEARTNLAVRSEALGTTWAADNSTISSNAIAAPDGAITADALIETTANNFHRIYQQVTIAGGTTFTLSCFVHVHSAGSKRYLVLAALNGANNCFTAIFDPTGVGSVTKTQAGSSGVYTSSDIYYCGNGWYRCIVTGSITAANPFIVVGLSNSGTATIDTNGNVIYTGDGSSGLVPWGVQPEIGSFASSYIPTAGSTVTRAADLVTLAGTLFPLSQTEGTLYAKFAGVATSAAQAYVASLDNNSTAELIAISKLTNNALRYFMNDGSVAQVNMDSTATAASLTQAKAAIGYKLNDCAAAFLGETVQSDIICTMPTTDRLTIGNRSGGATPGNMWIFELAYFPTRKTNSQLQSLASGYASDALLLMGAETQGLTFAATDQSMSILDTGTPANAYTGELSAKLGSIRTSAGMTYLSSGLLGWGPENLFERSAEFDNAYWTKTNTTISANAVAAPDGTITADKIIEGSNNGIHSVLRSVSGLAAGVRTLSIYVKAAERGFVLVYDAQFAGGKFFNLTTGAVGNTEGNDPTSAAAVDAGNGWWRCSITVPIFTASELRVFPCTANGTYSYQGDGTSGIYLWGAQLERAASASTYKPTTSAAYYGLRLDYDSRLSGGPGYLVEEARTNLLTYSQAFDNAAWSKTDITITADNTTAPDGTTTADLHTDGTAGTSACVQSPTVTVGSAIAFSVYAKRGNSDWLFVQIAGSGTERLRGWFNLSTGVVGTAANVAPATGATVSIQSVGNGWYRCNLVGTLNGAGSTAGCLLTTMDADNSLTRVNSSTRYLWGAQLEAGAFATSYIPTTSATVTRAADAAKIATTAYPNNTAAATFYARFTQISVASATYGIMSFDSNSRALYTTSGNVTRIFDGTAFASAGGTISALTKYKLASCYGAVGGLQITRDGATVGTAAYDGSFGTQTNLNLGESASAYLNGWLHEGRYFLGEKSAAQLQALAA